MKYLTISQHCSKKRLESINKAFTSSLDRYLGKGKWENAIPEDFQTGISTLSQWVLPHKKLTLEQYVQALHSKTASIKIELEDMMSRDHAIYKELTQNTDINLLFDLIMHRVEDRVYEELGVESEDMKHYEEAHGEVFEPPELQAIQDQQLEAEKKMRGYLEELNKNK
jgi:hypothetical protein